MHQHIKLHRKGRTIRGRIRLRLLRATIHTESAIFVPFIARLVNDSHEIGHFCAFRCPHRPRKSAKKKIVEKFGRKW